MSYDAVVFDNDGVLTHPTPDGVLPAAAREAYRAVGIEPTDELVTAAVDEGPLAVHDLAATAGHDLDPETVWRRREAAAASHQRRVMEAGAKPLYDDVASLSTLAARRPTGIVSNNQHETVQHVLDVFGLRDRFESAYGRAPTVEGFRRRKPQTHYLERALGDLGVDPTTQPVLYVGDSRVDVEVAARLGVDSAFVRRPHRKGYALSRTPTHEVTSLREVVRLAVPDVEFDTDAEPNPGIETETGTESELEPEPESGATRTDPAE